jgi:hypothetical protein
VCLSCACRVRQAAVRVQCARTCNLAHALFTSCSNSCVRGTAALSPAPSLHTHAHTTSPMSLHTRTRVASPLCRFRSPAGRVSRKPRKAWRRALLPAARRVKRCEGLGGAGARCQQLAPVGTAQAGAARQARQHGRVWCLCVPLAAAAAHTKQTPSQSATQPQAVQLFSPCAAALAALLVLPRAKTASAHV